jgi:type IV pilus assembly protein PilP
MKNRLWRIQEQANHVCAQSFFGKRDYDFLNKFLGNFLKTLIRAIAMCALFSLAACNASGDENLGEWMATVRRTVHTSPLTLPAPLTMKTFVYDPAGQEDPFDASKISMLLDISDHAGVRPDLKRSREPLESYPLDQFRMIGSLGRPGQSIALVEVGKILYQLRKGNHLGQDLGEVINIMDGSIEIEETIQEANGTWVKRRVQLSMREAK